MECLCLDSALRCDDDADSPSHVHIHYTESGYTDTHSHAQNSNDDDTIMLWSSAHLCYPLAFHCVRVRARVCYKNKRCGCECSLLWVYRRQWLCCAVNTSLRFNCHTHSAHTAARCNGLCTLYSPHMYANTTCCPCVCVEYEPVFETNKERWKGSKVKWRCTTWVSVSVCALWPVQTCLCIMCFELMCVCVWRCSMVLCLNHCRHHGCVYLMLLLLPVPTSGKQQRANSVWQYYV